MKNALISYALIVAVLALASCNGEGTSSDFKLIPVKVGKDFQYIDQDGKIVINPQFSEASLFREGLALVKSNGDKPLWGFISEDGKFVIPANYKSATVFSEGLAWVVSENSAPTAITEKGEIKITLQDCDSVKIFKGGMASFSVSDSIGAKWGFVDKEGKVKINPQFSETGAYSNGKCAVKNSEGKWGYIDVEGKIIVSYQFDKAKDFEDGHAVVSASSKYGVIDEAGKYSINPQYGDIKADGNIFLFKQDGKWGWCDNTGKIVINPQFTDAYPFLGSDLAAVKSGDKYAYIDKDGKIVITPQFDEAFPFNGKLAMVKATQKIGFIDNQGKYVVNPQFDNYSEDVKSYMSSKNAKNESVESDFFNIDAIVNRINVVTPEGLAFGSNASDAFAKYKKPTDSYFNYAKDQTAIIDEKLSKDATLSFNVIMSSSPYDLEQIGDPAYVATCDGFEYIIQISGKGKGKEKNIKDAIEKKFTGFKKDDKQSSDSKSIYDNGKQTISCELYGSRLSVKITIAGLSQGGWGENIGD